MGLSLNWNYDLCLKSHSHSEWEWDLSPEFPKLKDWDWELSPILGNGNGT